MAFWIKTVLAAFVCLIGFHFFNNLPVLAQSGGATTGEIIGKVTDTQGNNLGGVSILARQFETGFTRQIQTAESGEYALLRLPPGQYEIKAESDGFATKTSRLTLAIGTTGLVIFQLTPAGTNEVIEVRASDADFLGEKTESSSVINRQQIDGLPINQRNFLDFAQTTARAVPDPIGGQGVLATSGISFNGQLARFNNVSIDGLDNNDRVSGAVRTTFSQEAVQEFQVVSDGFSAEFGRATGGIINIITRTGSNEFHGNLFYFNRNDTISARDAFTATKAPFSQYQYGATFGGPLRRDRSSFFTSFERLNIQQNNIVTIPDGIVSAASGAGYAFQNGPIPFSVGRTALLARVDTQLSSQDTFWVRYNGGFASDGSYERFGGLIAQSSGGLLDLNEHTVAVGNLYASSAHNYVNETRFLYSHRDQSIAPLDRSPHVQSSSLAGLVEFGRSTLLPNTRKEHIFHLADTVTLTRGNQTLKFGGDLQFFHQPEATIPLLVGGLMRFTGLDLAALIGNRNLPFITELQTLDPRLRTPAQILALQQLSQTLPQTLPNFPKNVPLDRLPLPLVYIQSFGNPNVSGLGTRSASAFIEDEIKVTSSFLVRLGARYDWNQVLGIDATNGNFSPRIGLSWQPTQLRQVTLRAGYGIFVIGPLAANAGAAKLAADKRLDVQGIPFPFSVLPLATPERRIPEGATPPPDRPFIPQLGTIATFQPDLKNSYSHQANLTLTYALTTTLNLSAGYSFVRGIRQSSVRNINPVVRPRPNQLEAFIDGRVDPTQGSILETESAFDSYYHGVTLGLEKRFASRFSFLSHYTFSKSIDNFDDIFIGENETNDPLQPGLERGLSSQDARHRLVISGLWNLDYTTNPILKDFQLSGILNLKSGSPYNLLSAVDINGNGDFPIGDRPLGIARNAGILPGFAGFDLRLTRKFSIGERVQIEALVESFNLFNRTNISEINRIFQPNPQRQFILPSQENGRYIAPPERFRNAFAPRQFQFGIRVSY